LGLSEAVAKQGRRVFQEPAQCVIRIADPPRVPPALLPGPEDGQGPRADRYCGRKLRSSGPIGGMGKLKLPDGAAGYDGSMPQQPGCVVAWRGVMHRMQECNAQGLRICCSRIVEYLSQESSRWFGSSGVFHPLVCVTRQEALRWKRHPESEMGDGLAPSGRPGQRVGLGVVATP